MNNTNLNLNFDYIQHDEIKSFLKEHFERRYPTIQDIINNYIMLCCFDETNCSRSIFNTCAIEIGIIDYERYKTKAKLIDEIHNKWLFFFHLNMSQFDDHLKDSNPALLIEIKNRIRLANI